MYSLHWGWGLGGGRLEEEGIDSPPLMSLETTLSRDSSDSLAPIEGAFKQQTNWDESSRFTFMVMFEKCKECNINIPICDVDDQNIKYVIAFKGTCVVYLLNL